MPLLGQSSVKKEKLGIKVRYLVLRVALVWIHRDKQLDIDNSWNLRYNMPGQYCSSSTPLSRRFSSHSKKVFEYANTYG